MREPVIEFEILIQNAKVFNNGEPARTEDIGISNGEIVARETKLKPTAKTKIIDASGYWAMPGLFDIHTHYDLELELAPGLPESTRHGTTTVVIANCSLGLAFGSQRHQGADPIVDCYARVENIPKSVLKECADKVYWQNPKAYIEHLEQVSMGPNVITMLPHSMLRIEVMGFNDSVNRDPSSEEVTMMQTILKDSLQLGYVGFSTDALPFHYLANKPNCHKTIPTQFAKYAEIKQLTSVVREMGGIWQATPPKDSAFETLKTFLLSSGRLHGKPLKTTVVAALDVANNRRLVKLARLLAKILNTRLFDGRFYMQALGAPFKIWSDGAVTPIAEEIPELRRLNETDLDDSQTRLSILNDPQYISEFKAMWMKGKSGVSMARLKRILRLEDYAFDRDLNNMTIEVCPHANWQGQTFQSVFEMVLAYNDKNNSETNPVADQDGSFISGSFAGVCDEADFVLQILRSFDTKISWSTVTANRDMHTVRKLLMDRNLLPGFNDSGAHLTNMAFYDVNLRSLKLAAQGGEDDLSYMVKRLTKDAADVFGVAGGTIDVGDIADLILIDPAQLDAYDGEANVARVYRAEFQHDQLVNRSNGVVPLVLINGQIAWQDDQFSESLGKVRFGRLLKPTLLASA